MKAYMKHFTKEVQEQLMLPENEKLRHAVEAGYLAMMAEDERKRNIRLMLLTIVATSIGVSGIVSCIFLLALR